MRSDGLRRRQALALPPFQPGAHVVHRAAARAPVRCGNRQQDERVAAAVPAPAVDERQVVRRRRDARAAKARKHLAGKVPGRLFRRDAAQNFLYVVAAQLVLPQQNAIEVCHRRRALRRLAAGLLHRLRREAPLVDPLLVQRLFIVAGRMAHAQTREQALELRLALAGNHEHLLCISNLFHAALRPFLCNPVGNLKGNAPRPAFFLFVFKQHDDDLLGQFVHLYPIENRLIIAVTKGLRVQRPAHLVHEVPVIQLLAGLFRAGQRDLLEVVIGVAHRIVARLAHEALALPVAVRALHVLRGHIEVARHGSQAHALRMMVAEHQAIEIDLHKVARRAQHILSDEHIFHRRGVKQRRAVVKRTERHETSSL